MDGRPPGNASSSQPVNDCSGEAARPRMEAVNGRARQRTDLPIPANETVTTRGWASPYG
jgi:hypothetical protein